MAECFEEIWRKYRMDERVSESLKRVGPAFPLPGPHYDYADLVEHVRYSLHNLCRCDPDELPEYHLFEIYKRRSRLAERSRDIAAAIPEREYEHYRRHLDELVREWEGDFKAYFKKCAARG